MALRKFKYSSLRYQKGAVLLAITLMFVIAISFGVLKKLNKNQLEAGRAEETVSSLIVAKQALIAYAVNNIDSNPGEFAFLPCPDYRTGGLGVEGAIDPNCGGQDVNIIGRLPWSSLGIPPLRDGSGECLWYAVTGSYKSSPKTVMLNDDNAGAFQLFSDDGGPTLVVGNNPQDRIVALVIAPGPAIIGQDRAPLANEVDQCGGNYNAANYLDIRGGINNSNVSAVSNSIDQFITARGTTASSTKVNAIEVNDVIFTITASELHNAVKSRNDFSTKLYDAAAVNNFTRSIADCVAAYGLSHGGGNYSLPWPAPTVLADYSNTVNYNDVNDADNRLFGRIPDTIDDSNAITGGGGNLITDCPAFAVGTELRTLWENWKDHVFYSVAQVYQPGALPTPFCGNGLNCITINNDYPANANRDYAAVVIFSGETLSALGQSRTVPPMDAADQKSVLTNYLENSNNILPVYNDGDGTRRYDYQGTTNNFNDILYCINDDDGGADTLQVTACPTN